jgi:hypothetical protein
VFKIAPWFESANRLLLRVNGPHLPALEHDHIAALAEELDARIRHAEPLGRNCGLPVVGKDLHLLALPHADILESALPVVNHKTNPAIAFHPLEIHEVIIDVQLHHVTLDHQTKRQG